MGNVYRQDSQRLNELLDKASASGGATLLIPDLQRPYVWTPNQVTLLIDSLVRGWPFGTLLLWKVNHQELQGIPFRPFWTVIDRKSGESNGAQVAQMNPPAEYHMVLDGQQRVQNLLLALGGDDWGFVLEDRDWTEEIKERRPRGRQAKYRHWSKASLCFDLHAFIEEYNKENNSLLAIDFRKVLAWAITDPQNGQSTYPKPDNYEDPLPKAYIPANQQRLIRLSRLWKEAQPNPALKEAQFRQILMPLLQQHGVAPEIIEKLLQPLGELMTTLRDVKLADITFLELQPYDPQTWTPDTYNDAIVSIFTRLNTAGRTLTREEITLAWLKVGWETQITDGKSAGQCFAELRKQLEESKLVLEVDELVRAASFVWSVSSNEGRLLANSDLLKGDVIRPMASALSRGWKTVCDSFTSGARSLAQRELVYGPREHFYSLYALAVLWAWLYIAESWKADHKLGELGRDDFDKRCNASFARYIDRWIMCSQWAGTWSESSTTTVEAYAKSLTELSRTVEKCDDPFQVHQEWDECFRKFVENLATTATNYVAAVSAPSRERVAIYRNLLWVWHRLESDRWEKSQVQLRVGKSKATSEVDHVVSFALWKTKLQSGLPKDITDEDEAVSLANKLGNCALLEKNFNISKSDKPLKSFLSQIHEVRENKIRIDAWCAALAIPQPLLDPSAARVDDISEAIENRDKELKADLTDFIRGVKVRVDVETPQSQLPGSMEVAPVSEQMTEEATEHSGPPTEEHQFSSTGDRIDGSSDETQEDFPDEPSTVPRVGTDLHGLCATYREDASVRAIVDHFASRERNQKETQVHRLETLLERDGSTLSRSAIIRAFRRLDILGIGRFIPGRKGHPTRFEWYVKSLSVRSLAEGKNGAGEESSLPSTPAP
jgi:hypothetical protein